MGEEPIHLEVGDVIEVYGQIFVLTETTKFHDKPATVVFKQPIEMAEVK